MTKALFIMYNKDNQKKKYTAPRQGADRRENVNKEIKIKGLETIRNQDQIPENAAYYSKEIVWKSQNTFSEFYRFYNNDLEVLKDAYIGYSNLLKGLKRIVKEENKGEMALRAYNLKPFKNGFLLVEDDKDTKEALELISDSVKD